MVSQAPLEQTEAGLVPASTGWFVMNARDARWFDRPGRGNSLPLSGSDEFEAETFFPMPGMSIQVLSPAEPNSMYHWETQHDDLRHSAGLLLRLRPRAPRQRRSREDIQEVEVAYARFPPSQPTRLPGGL